VREAEASIADLRPQIKAALLAIESDVPFAVRQRWSSEAAGGVCVTYAEIENRSTECPVVDELSYQIDVWAQSQDEVTYVAGVVNDALLEMGLKRQSRKESVEENGVRRCTMVFGRKVDKRWGRFID
jgi:hypothetical protein